MCSYTVIFLSLLSVGAEESKAPMVPDAEWFGLPPGLWRIHWPGWDNVQFLGGETPTMGEVGRRRHRTHLLWWVQLGPRLLDLIIIEILFYF